MSPKRIPTPPPEEMPDLPAIEEWEKKRRGPGREDRPYAPPPPGGPGEIPDYDPEKQREWEDQERKRRKGPENEGERGVTVIDYSVKK